MKRLKNYKRIIAGIMFGYKENAEEFISFPIVNLSVY